LGGCHDPEPQHGQAGFSKPTPEFADCVSSPEFKDHAADKMALLAARCDNKLRCDIQRQCTPRHRRSYAGLTESVDAFDDIQHPKQLRFLAARWRAASPIPS
jgi:hypothetical protein